MEQKTLSIELKREIPKAIKFGFTLQASIMVISTLFLIVFACLSLAESFIWFLIIMSVALLFLYFSKNYLNNFFLKEFIIIEGNTLTILIKYITSSKTYQFNLDDIIFFGHEGARQYTAHPMHNTVVDFTGLGTVERELQYLIDEGTIEIETASKKLKFGKQMTSWDMVEVISEIELFIGRKLNNKHKYQSEEEQQEELD